MPLEDAIPPLTQVSGSKPGALPFAGAPSYADMDSDAFAGFYERSARPLWAYLARVSGDPALADDLLQESYIRFLAADAPRADVDGEVAARRYLFRIATNLLRDHWRKPKTTAIEDVSEEHFRAPDTSDADDTRVLLGPALLALKPRERQLLWLAYAEGYSHREIAAITGLASASVRLLLFRARRRAAHLLRPDLTPVASRGGAL
jgi:RNA polymerase sigma-70 factor, ECF subfamily